MPRGSSPKRERQYEHIKESYEERGQGQRAEEIAARTVNKDRAEAGETQGARAAASRSSSRSGKSDKPRASRSSARSGSSAKPGAGRTGGRAKAGASRGGNAKPNASRGRASAASRKSERPAASSGKGRSGSERTRQELYDEARRQGIEGRSSMNKAQLERALGH